MSPNKTFDVHSSHVRPLIAQRDWAALVRYWIAHRYDGALLEAIRLVDKRSFRHGKAWRRLAALLRDFAGKGIQLHFDQDGVRLGRAHEPVSSELGDACDQATVHLLLQYPRIILCNSASQFPLAMQERMIAAGLAAANDALSLRSAIPDPPVWAMIRLLMGCAHQELRQLALARDALQEALASYKSLVSQVPNLYEPYLAQTLNSAGIVHLEMTDVESGYNSCRDAVNSYRTLASRDPRSYRLGLATALDNLGNVHRALKAHALARDCYQEALTLRIELGRREGRESQADRAKSLVNLATAQTELGDLNGSCKSLGDALSIYRLLAKQALRVYEYQSNIAMCLSNLGAAQTILNYWGAAYDSLNEALEIYEKLAERRPDVYRSYVAGTLGNLGVLHAALNDLRTAHSMYKQAIEVYTQESVYRSTVHLTDLQRCWTNLSQLYLREASWLGWPDLLAARRALREAVKYAEIVRGRFIDSRQRRRVQTDALQVYEKLVQTCVDGWHVYGDADALCEAVAVAEASRARNLMEMLADETLHLANAPPEVVEEFRMLRRRLRQSERLLQDEESRLAADVLREIDKVPPTSGRLQDLRSEVERLRDKHRERLAHIQERYDPEFNPDQPVSPIDAEAARQLLPMDLPTAIVQFCLTSERGLALVITRDGIRAVALPDLNDRQAREVAEAWYQTYYCWRGRSPSPPDAATWDDAIARLLEPVAERAVRPVVEALAGKGIERLILSPNRALHIFPLHACRLADGRYLGDAFEVVYTPSLSILHRCAGRRRSEERRLLLAENPTYDLPFTEVEGADLRRLFPAHTALKGSQVSKEGLLQEGPHAQVLHYTGHATFDPEDPLRSALVLKTKDDPKEWLTLRDIFCGLHLGENVLTVISGCESGMLRPDRVDEYVGLPSGFLYAGATCVVSSLWAVYDLSSALLLDRFHEEWLSGKHAGAALRAAQRWLRDEIVSGTDLRDRVLPDLLARLDDPDLNRLCALVAERYAERYPDRPPFASPVHWAPFIATGLTYPLQC